MSGQNWRFYIISDDDINIEDIGIWLENFAHRAIDWDVDWDADDEHFEYTVNVEFEYPLQPRMQRMLRAFRNLGYNVIEIRSENTDDEEDSDMDDCFCAPAAKFSRLSGTVNSLTPCPFT